MESLNSSIKAVLITPLVSSLEFGCRNERLDQNIAVFCYKQTSLCTWKSSSASSWFWMMGRVLISFSVFMVRITPSALKQTRAHTTNSKKVLREKWIPSCWERNYFAQHQSVTLASSWWSPLLLVYRTWLFHSGIGCSVWWRLTCYILGGKEGELLLGNQSPWHFIQTIYIFMDLYKKKKTCLS